MNAETATQPWTATAWWALLQDKEALLRQPGTHHKQLNEGAYALLGSELINRDDLCDLLELADAALAYAIEMLIDEQDAE